MANLQLNIEVNDEQFKELCANNIEGLPKEKMEEILIKAVEVALIRDKENPYYDKDSNILVKKVEEHYYGSSYTTTKYEPTELLNNIIKKVDLTDYIDTLAETVKNYIENNYEEIIKKYVVESFAEMIFSRDKAYELRNTLISDVNHMLENR